MGVNALRHYHGASNKELLRDLYKRFGIRAFYIIVVHVLMRNENHIIFNARRLQTNFF